MDTNIKHPSPTVSSYGLVPLTLGYTTTEGVEFGLSGRWQRAPRAWWHALDPKVLEEEEDILIYADIQV